MSSPESIPLDGETTGGTFSAVPSTSAEVPLTGVALAADTLLDLVVNQLQDETIDPDSNKPAVPDLSEQPPIATNTLEDLEAASTLLSLGDTLKDTLEEEDDNALLMPIGGANNPEDLAPQPLRLDQVSVDNVIAGLVETEELEKDVIDETKNPADDATVPIVPPVNVQLPTNVQTQDDTNTSKKGLLKTKTYVLKKKPEAKRSFRCSECNIIKTSIQKLNEHHRRMHNPQMCGVCNRTFELASSLTRHMYEHEEKRFKCKVCDYASHFESELETHKIVHRKNPSYKCMHANCDKWFQQKWDLTLHLQKHEGKEHKCDYDGCTVITATRKQLKEHQKHHSDDFPYECKTCQKGFQYRSGLKHHRDKDHKMHNMKLSIVSLYLL